MSIRNEEEQLLQRPKTYLFVTEWM